jgi:hypothetical protein
MRSVSYDMDRFNLNKLNHVEIKEEYIIRVSKKFASLGKFYNIKASATNSLHYFELK